ncbi:hypothetical protein GCM10022262_17980 [Georgenia daeguensis]|uniref:AAA+ ATPase domain-containing protein n=1 Tax=Georgenia daeguensis TaxID=908355 RepID=A0ABP8ETX6_9MICO
MFLRLLESEFALTFAAGHAREELQRHWSRCVLPSSDGAAAVAVDDSDPSRLGTFRYPLTSRLTNRAIENLAGRFVSLHACGLSDGTGRVLALVGASGSGKTTAALALASDDFGYVTDETVAVDRDGRVVGFPRPLAVADPESVGGKSQRGPDELGLRTCPDELTLGAIVLLHRVPERRDPPRLERLSLLDAVTALVPHTSFLTSVDRPLQALAELTERCGVFRLTFRDVQDTRDLLRPVLGAGRPTGAAPWTPSPPPLTDDAVAWGLRDGRVRQVPCTDAVDVGDETLVLLDRRPVRLSGIGRTLWHWARSAPSRAEALDHVVELHGQHPDADRLVGAAITTMQESGVLGHGVPQSAGQVLAGRSTARGRAGTCTLGSDDGP